MADNHEVSGGSNYDRFATTAQSLAATLQTSGLDTALIEAGVAEAMTTGYNRREYMREAARILFQSGEPANLESGLSYLE
jgi:hypothetical protein